ncbi:BZ3500_MvSof-1268-A1-R1_Chr2-2g04937 [Microbotryum saponariae]|uniref:RBR-type E3 ubiquitin transferase n=1 Tax=Microbotryum saponariae TaxID=289078 RepID=A0A2X0L4W9_9BASI|nr:BZ3500_MvSof-1268-A1-R1_Chr2-2g04937 [Microbotryum saponariae]SDA00519.1 BZ3501_MvSof-1269-A2-R1_Chr2-2g04611 [Microbotryum saponariae]
MNDVQKDELLALELTHRPSRCDLYSVFDGRALVQSILPDCMTWTREADKVHVAIKVHVDLGQDRQVHVWDLAQHPAEAIPESTMTLSAAPPRAVPTILPAALSSEPTYVAHSEGTKPKQRDRGLRGKIPPTHLKSSSRDTPVPSATNAQRPEPVIMSLRKNENGTTLCTAPVVTRRAQIEPETVPSEPLLEARPAHAAERSPDEPRILELRYLPPIEMLVILSGMYPRERGPDSIKIIDRAQWLPEDCLNTLTAKLNDGECIQDSSQFGPSSAYFFNDSLVEILPLQFPVVLKQRPRPSFSDIEPFSTILSAHDLAQRTSTFSLTTYTCSLCLTSFKGTRCVRLAACSDVFCLQCLKDFFTLMITEGMVRSVYCPGAECITARVKWEREHRDEEEGRPGKIGKEELRAIVGDALVGRYEWLLQKQTLESDHSVSYCPRCEAGVLKTDDDEKLRICKSFHTSVTRPLLDSAIVTQFLSGSPSTQAALEHRYGKANIRRLVAVFEEERLNREWMDRMTMKCPGCDVGVEKSQGCNHMQCSRCSSHFCFRCGKSLSAIDPCVPGFDLLSSTHFSTPGSSCYQKPFDFVAGPVNGMLMIDQAERDENVAVALQQESWYEQGWNPFE